MELIYLLAEVYGELFHIMISHSQYCYRIQLFAERDQVLCCWEDFISSINPDLNVVDQITRFIIKLQQFSINMILLKTSNCSFSDDSSRSDALSNQFRNVKSTTFWNLVNQQLLLNYLVRIFTPFHFNDLLMSWIQVLQVDCFINVSIRILKVKLFHVHLINLQFHLFHILYAYCQYDIIFSPEKLFCFLCYNCNLLTLLQFIKFMFWQNVI